ncbi:MAG: RNA polymerase sigma-70 factor (ECF subfamily) [Chlamydiales bacterium]|jgi:RNA polymerase sigma-70 factor (ECF subfamily)
MLDSDGKGEVTELLVRCREGDGEALPALLAALYSELKPIAQRQIQAEARGHTLQPTALVHEAYLKLVGQRRTDWVDRAHFLSTAATAMRRILVNHAHSKGALKRGGGQARITLFEAASVFDERADNLVALDAALEKLSGIDSEKARIVELRFFAGLDVPTTARVVGVAPRTVERGWRFAKAWLHAELRERA